VRVCWRWLILLAAMPWFLERLAIHVHLMTNFHRYVAEDPGRMRSTDWTSFLSAMTL